MATATTATSETAAATASAAAAAAFKSPQRAWAASVDVWTEDTQMPKNPNPAALMAHEPRVCHIWRGLTRHGED